MLHPHIFVVWCTRWSNDAHKPFRGQPPSDGVLQHRHYDLIIAKNESYVKAPSLRLHFEQPWPIAITASAGWPPGKIPPCHNGCRPSPRVVRGHIIDPVRAGLCSTLFHPLVKRDTSDLPGKRVSFNRKEDPMSQTYSRELKEPVVKAVQDTYNAMLVARRCIDMDLWGKDYLFTWRCLSILPKFVWCYHNLRRPHGFSSCKISSKVDFEKSTVTIMCLFFCGISTVCSM